MADSGGHWKTLAEAQKLTQSLKIPGVYEEDFKRNNPIDRMPVAQAAGTGLKIEWLEENTTTESTVTEVEIGGQLSWSDDIEYTEKETSLRTIYIQRKLAHFNQGIYSTYNNFEQRKLFECEKGMKRRIGSRIIYGDTTYGGTPTQWDGLHAWAATHGAPWAGSGSNDKKNMDMATGALSLTYLRTLVDEMKLGVDELLMPWEIVRRIDAAYQEKGFAGLKYDVAGGMSFIQMGYNELGKRILFWDGIPIIRTDFLVAEEDGTGTGATSNARALHTSTEAWSIFAVKYGDGSLDGQSPGMVFGYGGTEGQGDLYKIVRFPELPDYDASGLRLVNYGCVMMLSTFSLGRIADITDAAIVV